jgi:general secretion pathway protein G
MIVVLILGALAAIAIPRIMGGTETARENVCETGVNQINRCLEMYYGDTGSWPATLDDFIENSVYFPDDPPECPYGMSYKWETTKGEYRVKVHKGPDHK